MLTSPNVRVPDQNGREDSDWYSLSSGNGFLLLLTARRLQTRSKRFHKRRGLGSLFRQCFKLRLTAFCFRLDVLHYPLAILVGIIFGTEVILKNRYKLLCHLDLSRIRSFARRGSYFSRGKDLLGMTKSDQKQISINRTQ